MLINTSYHEKLKYWEIKINYGSMTALVYKTWQNDKNQLLKSANYITRGK